MGHIKLPKSPADLIRMLSDYHGEGLPHIAEALELAPAPEPINKGEGKQSDGSEVETVIPPAQPLTPDARPKLTFFSVRMIKTRDDQPIEVVQSVSGELEEPPVPAGGPLVHPELVPWSQLRPLITRALTEPHRGHLLDVLKLEHKLSRCQPIEALPKKSKRIWSDQCQFWRDASKRLIPIRRDSRLLAKHIVQHRGESGFVFGKILEDPLKELYCFSQHLGEFVAGAFDYQAKIIITSDLGLYHENDAIMDRWLRAGQQFAEAGCRPLVLIPASPDCWPAVFHRYFELVYWDTHHNFRKPLGAHRDKRFGAYHPEARRPDWPAMDNKGVTQLLALAAPAARIEYSLLRALRHLDPSLSITDEMRAILANAVWSTPLGIHFKCGTGHDHKSTYETQFQKLPGPLQQQAHHLIVRKHYHDGFGLDLRAEEHTRARYLQGDKNPLRRELGVYLHNLEHPDSTDREEQDNYRQWILDQLDRLPTEAINEFKPLVQSLRDHLQEEIKRGNRKTRPELGWSDRPLNPDEVQRLCVTQVGSKLTLCDSANAAGLVLCDFQAVPTQIDLKMGEQPFAPWDFETPPQRLPELPEPTSFQLDCHSGRFEFSGITQPPWANAFYRNQQGLFAQIDPQQPLPKNLEYTELPYPEWADHVGWDDYGIYAELSLPGIENTTQRFRYLPPGTFQMGSNETEPKRHDDETQHLVTLTQGFWIADTTVTQALWQAVMGSNPSHFTGKDLPELQQHLAHQLPVDNINWNDCQDFIQKLNQRYPQWHCQLPTEAQWEYAARAGTQTPFSLGNNIKPEHVNYHGDFPYNGEAKGLNRKHTVPVASLPANPVGLFEVHGNLWEWCQDWYQKELGSLPQQDPEGAASGDYRVLRGGAWNDYAGYCRSAYRSRLGPDARNYDRGFRLARGHQAIPASSRSQSQPEGEAERSPGSPRGAGDPQP